MKLIRLALIPSALFGCAVMLTQPSWAAVNNKPVAVISGGAGQAGYYLTERSYQFDANQSFDPDLDRLSYQWSLRDSNNQPVALSNARRSVLQLKLSKPGQYTLALQVNDGRLSSQLVTLPLQVLSSAPLQAEAGLPQEVKVGQLVSLSAVQSKLNPIAQNALGQSALNQNALSQNAPVQAYWQLTQLPAQSRAVLRDPWQLQTGFVPDRSGEYRLRLLLTDEQQRTSSSELVVTATTASQNALPQVRITALGHEVAPEQLLRLSAESSTDADGGDVLSYRWQVLQKPTNASVNLSALNAAATEFSSKDSGRYLLGLTVTDKTGASKVAQYEVVVSSGNLSPVSDFSLPNRPQLHQEQFVDGRHSHDPEQQPLQYHWQLLTKPAQSQAQLFDTKQSRARLTPDVAGQYWLALTVSDGLRQHTSQQVLVVPALPSLQVQGPTAAPTGQLVRLRAQSDAAAELTYQWELLSGPAAVTHWAASTQQLEFIAATAGTYRLAVSLSDDQGVLHQTTHDVQIQSDLPPVIDIKGPQIKDGQVGDLLQLDASASYDPEQGALQFLWQLQKPSGSQAQLVGADTATPAVQVDVAGQYLLTLTLTDDKGQQSQQTVTLNIKAPVVIIQGDVSGQLLDIDGLPFSGPAQLQVNNQPVGVDGQGRFKQQLQLEAGQAATVTLALPGMPALTYTSNAINTDGFKVQLPAQRLPAMQKIHLNLYQGCAFYNGPAELELEFDLQQFSDSLFRANWQAYRKIRVNSFEPTELLLPANAVYQVRALQPGVLLDHSTGSGKFASSQLYTHQYLQGDETIHAFTLCQQR